MGFLDRFRLVGQPNQEDFQKNLDKDSNKAFELLTEFISHSSYQYFSKRIPNSNKRFTYEWIINPFQFVRQTIDPSRYYDFSVYLSRSEVWNDAAPHFADSSVWTRVIEPMLYDCPEGARQKMADQLNMWGLLSRCLQEKQISSESAYCEWGIRV